MRAVLADARQIAFDVARIARRLVEPGFQNQEKPRVASNH